MQRPFNPKRRKYGPRRRGHQTTHFILSLSADQRKRLAPLSIKREFVNYRLFVPRDQKLLRRGLDHMKLTDRILTQLRSPNTGQGSAIDADRPID